jgi:hypothetical protein
MIPLNDLSVLYGRGVSSGVDDGELCGHVDLSMERDPSPYWRARSGPELSSDTECYAH